MEIEQMKVKMMLPAVRELKQKGAKTVSFVRRFFLKKLALAGMSGCHKLPIIHA